ncbi:hypothetical protein J2W68_002394 [Luteimonas terrae]|uniref:Uncharacterized protein n=1 Tax=Luteimonas terrae TaxID=1530191 RepID=A0ABU1XY10_9GAMM|nr:hypothetical protein [Luteimonas terrae]
MYNSPAHARTTPHATSQSAARMATSCQDTSGDPASATAIAVHRTAGWDGATPSTAGRFHIRATRIAA